MTTRTKENTLVVDDVRTMKFDSTIVRRLEPAFGVVYSQPWNEVWLDHDLEFSLSLEETRVNYTYNIRPLVKRMEEDAAKGIILPIDTIIIHSANPVGRIWMHEALSPWYNVKMANAEDWVSYERYPDWMQYGGDWPIRMYDEQWAEEYGEWWNAQELPEPRAEAQG